MVGEPSGSESSSTNCASNSVHPKFCPRRPRTHASANRIFPQSHHTKAAIHFHNATTHNKLKYPFLAARILHCNVRGRSALHFVGGERPSAHCIVGD